jgi:hypothetical protein
MLISLEKIINNENGKAKGLIVCSKGIGVEINADKNKYMIRTRDQNAGLIHSMKME